MKALMQLLSYLKPYKRFAILGPLFMLVEVGMDLLQPMLMQLIIDNGIATNNTPYVIRLSILSVLVAIIGLIGGVGCSFFSAKAAVHFATDIRNDVFRKLESFSSYNKDKFGIGKLITIATNDITAVQHTVLMTLKILVRNPMLFIGSIFIVFLSAREFFPILLVLIPILAIINWLFIKHAGRLFRIMQEAIDKLNTKLQETLTGIRVVKAFGREKFEINKFLKINEKLTSAQLTANLVLNGLMPVMLLIVNLGIVAALWSGAIKIDQGTTEIGVILAFINYLTITLNALIGSSHVLMGIARSLPSAERIVQVLDEKIVIEDHQHLSSTSIQGEIEFRNVSFSYNKTGENVLKNISFHVKKGEKIGIIGPIGSGKSTLMKLLVRLYDPDSGKILLDGKELKEYSLKQLREGIAFVPQKATLFSGTIRENLSYGKEFLTEEEMEKGTEEANAKEFIDELEGKFEYFLSRGAQNLSGGQKQRLSIARAFVRNAPILILDDSTSAVDALSERKILQSLRSSFKETTVFIIASKISSIKDADQIFVMDKGEIIGIGSHEELLETNQLYRDIYDTQVGKGARKYEKTTN